MVFGKILGRSFLRCARRGLQLAVALSAVCVSADEHPWGEIRDLEPTSGCCFRGKLNMWGYEAVYGDAWVAAFVGASTTPCSVAQVNASGNVVMNISKYTPFTLRFEVWDSHAQRLYTASNTITYSAGEEEKDNQTIFMSGTPPSFNVTFSLTGVAGGSGTRIGGGALSQTVQRCARATAPSVTASAGYEFVMWDEDFSCIKRDTVIRAVYRVKNEDSEPPIEERHYTVTYDLNGGTHGSVHPTRVTYDQAFYVSAPTRSGHNFTGWTVTSGLNTGLAKWGTTSDPLSSVSSSSTKCVNGTTGNVWFKNLTATVDGNVTLTANWYNPSHQVNDDFADATEITGETDVLAGSNVNATFEIGEPRNDYYGATNTVWWKWTATSSGRMMFKTEGSDFDTVLSVYTGENLVSLTKIAFNDDSDLAESKYWSAVMFPTVTGKTYYIAVAGYGGRTGKIQLKLSPATETGSYFKKTLAELGCAVPTDGTAYSVTAHGLPTGLKLVKSPAVTRKVKSGGRTKTVVVTPAGVNWWIEGVATTPHDYFMMPTYLTITVGGSTTTVPLRLTVNAQAIVDLGEIPVGVAVNEQHWLPGLGSGWSVSGLPSGLKYTAKLITTRTAKIVNGKKVVVVVTNALPDSVYGKPAKPGLYTVIAKKTASGYYETKKYCVLVTPKVVNTALFSEELENLETMAYEPFEWNLLDNVAAVGGKVVKVTGLPTGLSFAAANVYGYVNAKKKTGKYLKQAGQTIVGTPTKPGTYVVTFTKNMKSGKTTVAKTAQILWVVTKNDMPPVLNLNTAGGVIKEGTVGLSYTDLLAFSATEDAKVTASGLPNGITLFNRRGNSWCFTGVATKAGTYYVTVKATLNGRTISQRLALKVTGLPSWARGTFNGSVLSRAIVRTGIVTVNVTSAGKISGKLSESGTNWTLSATGFTGCSRPGTANPSYWVDGLIAKYGYKEKSGKKTVTKYVTRTFSLYVWPDEMNRGVLTLFEMEGSTSCLQQNLWGSSYKMLGKQLFYVNQKIPYRTYKVFVWEFGTRNLALKVTPTGVVTATLAWDTGKKDKQKKAIIYKPTCTSVLLPWSSATAPKSEFSGVVYVYFPPSAANNFPGLCTNFFYPFSY